MADNKYFKFNDHFPANVDTKGGSITNELGQAIYHVGVVGSPTSNCQWTSIFYMVGILTGTTKQEQKIIIKQLWEKHKKRMMLIDLNANLELKFEDLFPKETHVIKHPYVSTNNSQMILYLVKTLQISNW